MLVEVEYNPIRKLFNTPKTTKMQYHNFNNFGKKVTQCGMLLFNRQGNKMVIVLQTSGKYSVPKGGVEGKEDLFDAAKRELYEETGITLQHNRYEVKGKFKIQENKLFYIVRLLDDTTTDCLTPIDTKEIKMAQWISVNELQEMINSHPSKCNSSLRLMRIPYCNNSNYNNSKDADKPAPYVPAFLKKMNVCSRVRVH